MTPAALPDLPGDPDAVRAAARALAVVVGGLEEGARTADDAAHAAVERWSGQRSVDVRFAAQGVTGQLRVAARETAVVVAALDRLAGALERAQDEVLAARTDVRRAEDDTVAAAADPDHLSRVRRHAEGRVDDAHALGRAAVAAFADVVAAVSARAVDLSTDGDLHDLGTRRVVTPSVVAAAWRVLGGWVTPDCAAEPSASSLAAGLAGGPAAVARWWRSLSPLARLSLLRAVPERLGDADGLPGWARDLANRQRLATMRRRLALERARWNAGFSASTTLGRLPPPVDPRLVQAAHALGVLATLVAVPGRQLLTLDVRSGRRVHAAVGIGDVDRADDVGVFTPGLTSDVEGMGGYVEDLDDLREQSDRIGLVDGRRTATVVWLGYDAPQLDELADQQQSVVLPWAAGRGGAALGGFLAGVDAARRHRVHLVALGHSYGSTTTGLALRRRTGVDDVVLFGSPGVGALSADALRVRRGHLWDVDAPGDLVGGTMVFGATPAHSAAFQHLSSDASTAGPAVRGHTHYLDDGSTSQWNLAAVLAERPDLVVRVAPPGQSAYPGLRR